jgi:sugar lactone lactonase YvrE
MKKVLKNLAPIIDEFKEPNGICLASGKTMFITQSDAHEAMRARIRKVHIGLRVYPCDSCDCYHLTSQVAVKDKPTYVTRKR